MRRVLPLMAGVAAVATACQGSHGSAVNSAGTTAAAAQTTASTPAPSTVAPATTTSSAGPATRLPISVSRVLSSADQDPSILVPSSCTLAGATVTAAGTFSGGFVPEVYRRYGDVVELYAYNTMDDPSTGKGVQVLDLGREKPAPLTGRSWQVTAPVSSVGQPVHCFVAAQSTHAFMGAGSAGG